MTTDTKFWVVQSLRRGKRYYYCGSTRKNLKGLGHTYSEYIKHAMKMGSPEQATRFRLFLEGEDPRAEFFIFQGT